MKRSCQYFLILFLSFGVVNTYANSIFFEKKLEANDLAARDLPTGFKFTLKKKFSGYKIYKYCEGSFKEEGASEYALSIINTSTNKGGYVMAFYNNQNELSWITIKEFTLTEENKETGVSIDCESLMGIHRLNSFLSSPGAREATIHGYLKPINNFDSICTDDPDEATGHTCYSYDHKQNKFVSIGSWIT